MQVIPDYILALKQNVVDVATFEELDGLLAEVLQCLNCPLIAILIEHAAARREKCFV